MENSSNKLNINYDINLSEAEAKIKNYKYALIYMISGIIFCRITDLPDINWNECLEARFFCEIGEMHIFEEDDVKKVVEITDTGSENIIEKRYKLNKKFMSLGKVLCVQEYISYDEDGQIEIELTRLKDVC